MVILCVYRHADNIIMTGTHTCKWCSLCLQTCRYNIIITGTRTCEWCSLCLQTCRYNIIITGTRTCKWCFLCLQTCRYNIIVTGTHICKWCFLCLQTCRYNIIISGTRTCKWCSLCLQTYRYNIIISGTRTCKWCSLCLQTCWGPYSDTICPDPCQSAQREEQLCTAHKRTFHKVSMVALHWDTFKPQSWYSTATNANPLHLYHSPRAKILAFKEDYYSTVGGDGGCRVSEVYELALLPPCLTIRVLSYNNCQRSSHSIARWIFRNLALYGDINVAQ